MTPAAPTTDGVAPIDDLTAGHGYILIGGKVVLKTLDSLNSAVLEHELPSGFWVEVESAIPSIRALIARSVSETSTEGRINPADEPLRLSPDNSAATSTADAVEQELLRESVLAREFSSFVRDAENERFEDGMDSEFAVRVRESVTTHGSVAVAAWERVLWSAGNVNETGEELLRQLGSVEHPGSRTRRLRVLKDSLRSPDSRIRDAAGLGLSYLDDLSALAALKDAHDRESEGWLRESLKLVIDQLSDALTE